MKKPKIKVGQCYRKDDHVYMVIARLYNKYWIVQDTLSKDKFAWVEDYILKMERPFQNFG